MRDVAIAAVAPAAPAIAWGLLDLALAIAFVVSWGLLHGWDQTFGRMLQYLGHKSVGFVHPFGFLLTLDNAVKSGLGRAVAATERGLVYAFHQAVASFTWLGQSIAGLATDTYNAIRATSTTVVNHVTKVVNTTVVRPLTKTVKVASAVTAAQFRHLVARVRSLEVKAAHAVRTAGHAIAYPFPRIGRLEKDLRGQAQRLKKVEKALAIGASAALVWTALKRLGLSWTRCNNTQRFGKRICGVDSSWIDDFLAATLLIVGTESYRDFVKEAQAGFDLGLEGLQVFIRELGD